MNDTPADVQPIDPNQPEKNMNDPIEAEIIEAEIVDEFWNNTYLPLLIVVSFCCCWPIGLVLIGLHPKISRKTKTIVFGCCAVLFVIMMIMGAIGVAIDNAQFDEANTLWHEGKQEEAVAIYEDLVDGESGGILADSKLAIVYGRLIDHEASLQNVPRATMWMERAEKFDVVPKTRSEEAQVLISERWQKAQQAESQAEAPKKMLSLENGPIPISFLREHDLGWFTPEEGWEVEGTSLETLFSLDLPQYEKPYFYHMGRVKWNRIGFEETLISITLFQAGEDKMLVGIVLESEFSFEDSDIETLNHISSLLRSPLLPGFDLKINLLENMERGLNFGYHKDYGKATVNIYFHNDIIQIQIWVKE